MPTNLRAAGPEFLGSFYDKNPNFRTVSLQVERAKPWQGYPGGQSVKIWRTQREIINAVMRGEIDRGGRPRPHRQGKQRLDEGLVRQRQECGRHATPAAPLPEDQLTC